MSEPSTRKRRTARRRPSALLAVCAAAALVLAPAAGALAATPSPSPSSPMGATTSPETTASPSSSPRVTDEMATPTPTPKTPTTLDAVPATPNAEPGRPAAPKQTGGDKAQPKDRVAPAPRAADQPEANVTKSDDLGGAVLTPGAEFNYELTVQCSGLTAGCTDFTFTDTLPAGLDVTSLPKTTTTRAVTYDPATRLLTVVYKDTLLQPPGTTGLPAGATRNFEIGMRLPAQSPIADGARITNTANVTATNALPGSDDDVVTVSVPRTVTPVATKAWTDGSAVAGSDEASTIRLGVRNGSSSSAEVTELGVEDSEPETFEHFDLTGASVASFPAGADRAVLLVCTAASSSCADGDYTAGPAATSAGPLTLPAGIAPGAVTGVRVVFTDSAGALLPYDATGGRVDLGMILRDTARSTGETIAPTTKLNVTNCATPTAVDREQGAVAGADACRSYAILPDTIDLKANKTFVPDSDGNFRQDAGEYAVLGERSGVSALVDVKNNSQIEVAEIVIREPDATAAGTEFDKVDISKVRLRLPAGATAAHLEVTYSDGSTFASGYTANTTLPLEKSGLRVTGVEVTYTGTDADGNASIRVGSTAGLDVSGTLNDSVDETDLPGGTSPGVRNCAGFEGSAGRTDGTGTASGTACKDLSIEPQRVSGTGVKTVGAGSVPPGEPIPFTLRLDNNGNLPLTNPVITDPRFGADGKPLAPNPFDDLRITAASVSTFPGVPPVLIELYDPTAGGGTWVAYAADDAALLERAKGVRASVQGALAPTKSVTLQLSTLRRDGVPEGRSILNCFTRSANGYTPTDPSCAPAVETGPSNDSAILNKNISPSTLPRYVPGLPRQLADVTLTLRNNGNVSARSLLASDSDTDFFDATDFTKIQRVRFPTGADRVQVDALVGGSWVEGVPTGSTTPGLPGGVSAADVVGVRATFSSTSGANRGYVIRPCANDAPCQGEVVFQVSPRPALRSDAGTAVEGTLSDTADGAFETQLQPPGSPKAIAPVDATLTLTEGTPKISVDKTPNSSISPGETAPFYLKVTNTGSANVPNLTVQDLLPKGLAFDASFLGDAGQPFKVINTQVPDGTPAVPIPAFEVTNVGSRVSGLSWNFGDWVFAPGATLTIEIQVGLEPGVTAGQVVSNTMGASSPVAGFSCAGTSEVDGSFGDGTWCTDTASLTTNAGAAFQARKWVAGNPDLGWFNTRTGSPVPVSDPSCAATEDAAGTVYTNVPCIALVNPGDQYRYLLRLVNSGTEPGTDMRIIDRLPVQGDRGVVVNSSRGTDWDQRPRLASPPALDGPGTMTTTYTTSEPLCIEDLDMGGAGSTAPQCPSGAWDASFGPDVVAAQMQLTFATPLAPGEGVDITFAMDTPLDVASAGTPTIAWNSFAHAETTLRNGKPHVLPKTEPLEVGVALAYGTLHLEKQIGPNPASLPLADVPFTFRVVCTIDPIGGSQRTVLDDSYRVSESSPVDVPGLPAGAECRVWEADARGGISDHPETDPLVLTIPPTYAGDPVVASATVTNDFPDAAVNLTKTVTGAAAKYARDAFPVTLDCTFLGEPVAGFPTQLTLRPEQTVFQANVPAGAECTALETDSGGATEVTYDPAGDGAGSGTVTTASGQPQDIGITNDYRAGGLGVHKEVLGVGGPLAEPFRFEAQCLFDGRSIGTQVVTIDPVAGQVSYTSQTIEGLPAGATCTVSETDGGGADSTPPPVTVTVPDGGRPVYADFVGTGNGNQFSAGTISVSKAVDGAGADAPWVVDRTFEVMLTCTREGHDEDGGPITLTPFSGTLEVKAGDPVTATRADGSAVLLPVGTSCTATEIDDGGASGTAVADSAVVRAGMPGELQPLTVTLTNTFDLGELRLRKTLDGDAARYGEGRTYGVSLTCTLDQGDSEPSLVIDARPIALTPGEDALVNGIPVGARCFAIEDDLRGASEVSIDHGTSVDAVEVVGEGAEAVSVTITNTFDARTLTVGKKVIDGPAGPYRFEMACILDGDALSLSTSDAAFTLSSGQERVISLPEGAQCTVEEVGAPDGDTVTYLDTAGGTDSTVELASDLGLKVTNTFQPLTPGPGGPDDGNGQPSGGLAQTGSGPLGTLLLLALASITLGAWLVRRGGRAGRHG